MILLLLISSWNFHYMCQRFLCTQKQNFSSIWRNIRRETTNRTTCTNRTLWQRHVYRHYKNIYTPTAFFNDEPIWSNCVHFPMNCSLQLLMFKFHMNRNWSRDTGKISDRTRRRTYLFLRLHTDLFSQVGICPDIVNRIKI